MPGLLFWFNSPLGCRCDFKFSLPLSFLGIGTTDASSLCSIVGVGVLDTRCGVKSGRDADVAAFD